MDALSEVLRLARLAANVTLDATAHEPWCVPVSASEALMRAHIVVDGECDVRTPEQEATLRAGDFMFLPRGDAHLIGSDFDAPAVALSSLAKPPVGGELAPVRVGGRGRATRWISLSLTCERHLMLTRLETLPAVQAAGFTRVVPRQINDRGWIVGTASSNTKVSKVLLVPRS